MYININIYILILISHSYTENLHGTHGDTIGYYDANDQKHIYIYIYIIYLIYIISFHLLIKASKISIHAFFTFL